MSVPWSPRIVSGSAFVEAAGSIRSRFLAMAPCEFEYAQADWPRGHELHEVVEEQALFVDRVEVLGLGLGEAHPLERDARQARLLEATRNVA